MPPAPPQQPSFWDDPAECKRCGATSLHPNDVTGGLCAGCRAEVGFHYPDAPGYVAGSDTSIDAAYSMLPHVQAQERVVLRVLAAHEDGLTSDEVEALLGGRHQSLSARLRALVLKGLAVDTEERRVNRSGRRAVVRRITSAGRLTLRDDATPG